jgi:hypothetical protein
MRRGLFVIAALVAALLHPTASAAQGLPPGGYYADGAYYVPASDAAPAALGMSSACPPGYSYPTVYVAQTATMVRIQQVSLVGGDAPGFPYVPVYASQAPC